MHIIARHPVTIEPASKYCRPARPGWDWKPVPRQQFRPFSTAGEQLILALCIPLMLVLLVFMAA